MSLIHTVGNVLTWQAWGVEWVVVGRMVVGGSVHAMWEGMFILLQENTRPMHRPFTAALMNYGRIYNYKPSFVQYYQILLFLCFLQSHDYVCKATFSRVEFVVTDVGWPVLPDEGLEGPPADLHCPLTPPPLLPLPPGVTSMAPCLWGTQGKAQTRL